ncbi:hypothetical protein MKI84_02600 [Ancylobacter sp. A5.8]|nr:hypothetical protein [Ancylobacter gelatini]MCJ8141795.1 hypothetical protein [Ancylobacter gelatini]
MSVMMREIMTLFDEYQSKENAKLTLRAMKENARQGYWNGSRPPIGYRIVIAGPRGSTELSSIIWSDAFSIPSAFPSFWKSLSTGARNASSGGAATSPSSTSVRRRPRPS